MLHNFKHNFSDDVAVLLVGPRDQKVLLMSNAGGSNAVNSTYVGFHDESFPHVPDQDSSKAGNQAKVWTFTVQPN